MRKTGPGRMELVVLENKRDANEISELRKKHGFPSCQAHTDGDCTWKQCPQKVKYRVGCPLYDWDDNEGRSGG